MAKIYKKTYFKTDPKTGEKKRIQSKKWWGRYRDALGIERFVPLTTNQQIARQMFDEILKKVEAEKAGLIDPAEAEIRKPIAKHVEEYEIHMKSKDSTSQHVQREIGKIKRCIEFCQWKRITDIKATSVEKYLLHLRNEGGMSASTSNHYLIAIKAFARWLYVNERIKGNPLDRIKRINEKADKRHVRRPFSMKEFTLLLKAAETGPPAVGLVGPDRAMLYLLAAWTGFRRGELGSLTLKNFNLKRKNPTLSVEAAYSKHRRDDTIALHPDVVERFVKWVEIKKPAIDEILFPISERCCGVERRTSRMIEIDLKSAREAWLAEAETEKERQKREASDFLRYEDANGRYADFHALRHTFITNLCRANVSPKVAQTLARHSDVRLTLEIYSHITDEEHIDAINALPSLKESEKK